MNTDRHATEPSLPEPLLTATALRKRYPSPDGRGATVPVLDGIDVAVRPGELLVIVGPSGSGKSTLLHGLSGLDTPSSGQVTICGVDLAKLDTAQFAEFRRRHIGFVFQSYNLIASLTAAENVALPLRLMRSGFDRQRVTDALTAVGVAEVADRRPAQLSGGQQQRVAIARTLVVRPAITFADEPTGALDGASGARVLDLLRRSASGDRAVVMVTHDIEAAALGDRVLVLRDGAVHSELHRPTPARILQALALAREEAA
ncbi:MULTISPECIES: ABC transporter ATP-binding protein [unclassified Plantibacter]|uniref:ABC transporter ATP-binding protein n=1 Tax=unclassified Plantibacter TaxID=2624265 RepID=UPI000A68C1A8|nr:MULTISPECIES: ABC transporter ATP-binding protein [unclassified Plantibacter]